MGMRTSRITFQEVSYTAIKFVRENGKRRRKQKTFTHTINPFNKNKYGEVKTYKEVYADVRAEAKKWELEK
jgi:hypothetical protein